MADDNMDNTKKIHRALRLYPFYEAVASDYLFFSVIQTIFLTFVKNLSAEQVVTAILIADVLDFALEYPSYKIIQRLGNSRSILVGGVLPVLGILLVTFSQDLPLIAIGLACTGIAANFQSLAGAAARNNLMLLGRKEDFTKLFSRGSLIYSGVSMAASVLAPFLFSLHRYAPSILCFIICSSAAVIACLIPDYTEQGGVRSTAEHTKRRRTQERVKRQAKIGKGLRLLVIVFCMFFCAGIVFKNNAELLLSDYLHALVTEQEAIYIYGAIIWGARLVQFGSNAMMQKILGFLQENVVAAASCVMLIAFLSVGCAGLLIGKTMVSVIFTGIAYIALRGVFWDPLRTFLRAAAVDTNSKQRQQTMMMLLNIGQSGTGILMDLLVVGTLKLFSLEYVFLVFAAVLVLEIFMALGLLAQLRQRTELLRYHDVLNNGGVNRVSERVFACLCGAGFEKQEVLPCRILLEEKLINCMDKGAKNEPIEVVLTVRLDDFQINLIVGEEKIDIFKTPEDGDLFASMIFSNVVRNM